VLGGGAILSSLVLGSMAVFLIEREYVKASAFALAGAVLTFFGFMHGEAIGLAQTPQVALSYLLVAGVLYGCRYAATAPAATTTHPGEQTHTPGLAAQPAK
jgi:AGZA family xanthine/uracil permease-like MFS transporter